MRLDNARYALWALVVLAVAVAGGLAIGLQVVGRGGAAVPVAEIGGPFELVGTDGQPVSSDDLSDKPRAMFFGYTHCPDVCPTTLFEASGWLEELGPLADRLHVVFVSVDPERDTPDVLDTYMSAFDPRIIGLTGDPETVAKVAKEYRIFVRKVEQDGGDYTVDHTASVLLFDRDGQLRGTIGYNEPKVEALAKLRRLVSGG